MTTNPPQNQTFKYVTELAFPVGLWPIYGTGRAVAASREKQGQWMTWHDVEKIS